MGEYVVSFLFFFFQAEDGIRDYKVTGVQTCALPTCPPSCVRAAVLRSHGAKNGHVIGTRSNTARSAAAPHDCRLIPLPHLQAASQGADLQAGHAPRTSWEPWIAEIGRAHV